MIRIKLRKNRSMWERNHLVGFVNFPKYCSAQNNAQYTKFWKYVYHNSHSKTLARSVKSRTISAL